MKKTIGLTLINKVPATLPNYLCQSLPNADVRQTLLGLYVLGIITDPTATTDGICHLAIFKGSAYIGGGNERVWPLRGTTTSGTSDWVPLSLLRYNQANKYTHFPLNIVQGRDEPLVLGFRFDTNQIEPDIDITLGFILRMEVQI